MTLDQAVEYVVGEAKALGYSHHELQLLVPDLREMLFSLPSTEKDMIDQFIEDKL